MSEPTPPRGGAGKKYAGLPLWGWGVLAAAALGTIVYLKLRGSGAAAAPATTAGGAGGGSAGDQQSQYEQVSAQLTGIEGTDAALLEAIKDLQGDKSKAGDHGSDREQDRDQEQEQDRDRRDGRHVMGGGGTGPPTRRKRAA